MSSRTFARRPRDPISGADFNGRGSPELRGVRARAVPSPAAVSPAGPQTSSATRDLRRSSASRRNSFLLRPGSLAFAMAKAPSSPSRALAVGSSLAAANADLGAISGVRTRMRRGTESGKRRGTRPEKQRAFAQLPDSARCVSPSSHRGQGARCPPNGRRSSNPGCSAPCGIASALAKPCARGDRSSPVAERADPGRETRPAVRAPARFAPTRRRSPTLRCRAPPDASPRRFSCSSSRPDAAPPIRGRLPG